ncbi:MAG: MBL fold metallo-hydrolase [bacterium]
MKICVVGVGDAFSVKHWGTSFLVQNEGATIAVDCPDSYFRALSESGFGVTADDLDALVLTHLHGDHVNGLEMTLAWRKFVTKKRLTIFTTPEVAQVLWDGRLKASIGTMYDGQDYNTMDLADYADVHVVDWGRPTGLPGGLTVETRRTIHHIPTAALRLTSDDAVFAHSCDTAWDPTLVEWLGTADTFFHEANFGPAHTPIETLAGLDRSLREKMHVVHYSDIIDPSDFPGLKFARQGQVIDVCR